MFYALPGHVICLIGANILHHWNSCGHHMAFYQLCFKSINYYNFIADIFGLYLSNIIDIKVLILSIYCKTLCFVCYFLGSKQCITFYPEQDSDVS